MGVSVIAKSGPEMTKLNDLREEDEGKIKKKNHNYLDYCYEKVHIAASLGFINIYFTLTSYSNSESSACKAL